MLLNYPYTMHTCIAKFINALFVVVNAILLKFAMMYINTQIPTLLPLVYLIMFPHHTHKHAPIAHHKHVNVFKCDFCGRINHLAKFCFDLQKVSHLKNALK